MARGQGQGSSAAVKARPRGAPWRPAELQRRYRALLDSAKEEPQTIQDADGSLLIVEDKERADFERRVVEIVSQVGQFRAVYAAHGEEEPARWAGQTPFPWIRSLSRDEIHEFFHELLSFALDAAQRQTLENYEGNLRAWCSTAELAEQPEIWAQMTAPIDPRELREVFPPSEEEVREAEERGPA